MYFLFYIYIFLYIFVLFITKAVIKSDYFIYLQILEFIF